MRKIFLSGLTAVGKTTHAKLLSQKYQIDYISASSRLLSELDIDTNTISRDFWVSENSEKIKQKRLQNRASDISVDQQLSLIASQKDSAIFDTWGLPWLSTEIGLRIWLESSLITRCWKSYISHGAIGEYNQKEYESEITVNRHKNA